MFRAFKQVAKLLNKIRKHGTAVLPASA
jgi:hypothetical protein